MKIHTFRKKTYTQTLYMKMSACAVHIHRKNLTQMGGKLNMYCTSMHVCIINMFTGALTEQQCNGFSNINLYICSGETTHYKHIIHTHDTHTSFHECAHEQTHINIKLIKSTYLSLQQACASVNLS